MESKWHESGGAALLGMSFLVAAASFYYYTFFGRYSFPIFEADRVQSGIGLSVVVLVMYPLLGAFLARACELIGKVAYFLQEEDFLEWDSNERIWFAVLWPVTTPAVTIFYGYLFWFAVSKKIF